MYPLCCIDIRNFLNQFYFFSDDHFQHSSIVDDTLRKVGGLQNSRDEPCTDTDLSHVVTR
jgi:exocyst complex component Sec15